MSILQWFFKPKKEMAKPNTKRVRIGKYTVSKHAQNKIAEPKRELSKKDMVQNLYGKSKNSKTYIHSDGTTQYDRVNDKNRTITYITKSGNVVKTIRRYHNDKKGKHGAYKNF